MVCVVVRVIAAEFRLNVFVAFRRCSCFYAVWLTSKGATRDAAVPSWVRLGRVELLFVVSVVRILRPRWC